MGERVFVSSHGLNLLRERFEKIEDDLKRIRAEKALAYTASGDQWHDNPYFNKLEQDEFVKVREVAELQGLITSARVFTPPATRNTERVRLGSIVRFRRTYLEGGEEQREVWEIVGYGELDVENKRLAYNSPLAQALIGLDVGETRQVQTPRGLAEYEVLDLYEDWDEAAS